MSPYAEVEQVKTMMANLVEKFARVDRGAPPMARTPESAKFVRPSEHWTVVAASIPKPPFYEGPPQ